MTSSPNLQECSESTVGRSVTLPLERCARPTGLYPEQPRTREAPAGERRFRARSPLHARYASRFDAGSKSLWLDSRPPPAHRRRLRRGR